MRTYNVGDDRGILQHMKAGEIERTTEDWSWEYKSNPFGHLIGVADYDGQVVGHMGLVPICMKLGDMTTKGSQAVDLIVHPNFRGQGIFLAIGKMLADTAGREGIPFSYAFPSRAASHAGFLKFGWFDVCHISQLVKPINIDNMVDYLDKYRIIKFLNRHRTLRKVVRFFLQVGFAVTSSFNRISNRTDEVKKTMRTGLGDMKIRAIESFDDRFDDFWKEVSRHHSIIVVRNKKYLNWRYFEKPNTKYTVLVAERNGKISGYVVLRSKKEKQLRLGYIVDILVSSDNKGVIQSLFLEAIEKFRKENVDAILCWMLEKSTGARIYHKILKYNGFIHQISLPLIARVNSSQFSKEFAEDPNRWFVTIGDSDYI